MRASLILSRLAPELKMVVRRPGVIHWQQLALQPYIVRQAAPIHARLFTATAFELVAASPEAAAAEKEQKLGTSPDGSSDTSIDADQVLSDDRRVAEFGKAYTSEYSSLRDKYATARYPIVLCHGLMGFDTMRIGEASSIGVPPLAVVHYWKGIREALEANGNTVLVTRVPRTATIEKRAELLSQQIKEHFPPGTKVNVVGHSMGGLDARYMASRLTPGEVDVVSVTTVSTPHHGSPFADYCAARLGRKRLPRIYHALDRLGVDLGALEQLTTYYLDREFNPSTPDRAGCRYFSYGAYFRPSWLSAFRSPWRVIHREDGPNDGLVSVKSARWGTYKGTISDANHLDIINMANRIEWAIYSLFLQEEPAFNAVALYMDISDMLAKEGL
ncbi:lipase 2 [Savitreella phatthalungensis]